LGHSFRVLQVVLPIPELAVDVNTPCISIQKLAPFPPEVF
jgi:hypothetical protein